MKKYKKNISTYLTLLFFFNLSILSACGSSVCCLTSFTGHLRENYEPFAQPAVLSNCSIVRMLALGMLLCVTCAEDLARITEEEIVELTSDTFMGDGQVRR